MDCVLYAWEDVSASRGASPREAPIAAVVERLLWALWLGAFCWLLLRSSARCVAGFTAPPDEKGSGWPALPGARGSWEFDSPRCRFLLASRGLQV